jgi:hypothetical protein
MGVRRAIALVVVAGLVGGSGGAARASSHGVAPHASTTIAVWFKRDARLWRTKRAAPAQFPVRSAVRALLGGPNPAESAAGVKTAVPAATHLVSTSVAHGVATVNLTAQFASPAPKKQIRMRLAQLTFTVTQVPNVRAVHLEFNGSAVASIGGVAVPSHMRRADFRRLVPAIVVHDPVIGAHLAPSVRVTGTSNVFEAAMIGKVVNAGGRVIAKTFFTASCGTGCRGRFAVTLSYHVANAQDGTIVVSDTSATSGPPPHVVRIPVRLSP